MSKLIEGLYTTPEQSRRLLEFGVPEMSSDCFYWEDDKTPSIRGFSENCWQIKGVTPCWSVGMLNEIVERCSRFKVGNFDFSGTQLEQAIKTIEFLVEVRDKCTDSFKIDFSKLEE